MSRFKIFSHNIKWKFNRVLEEIKYKLSIFNKWLKGESPHKYAGLYVLRPKFESNLYLHKVIENDVEQMVFLSGHKGAEMLNKKQANAFIKFYQRAGKHKTRFIIYKKRVDLLLEEIKRQDEEDKANNSTPSKQHGKYIDVSDIVNSKDLTEN